MKAAALLAKHGTMRCLIPGVKVYLTEELETVDPFARPEVFRGEECFNGSLRGWKRWVRPSPEPRPDKELKKLVIDDIRERASYFCALHDRLLSKIEQKVPAGRPVVFISILRAGVFVALGLARRMNRRGLRKASVAAMGLFHEAGFDTCALNEILNDHPGYYPVFVDGWTGRGVVARELKKTYDRWRKTCHPDLPEIPLLATLVDPGHNGDLWGTDKDVMVPCAHFTAPEVFGFSRAFIKDPEKMWAAYRYPDKYYDPDLIGAWLEIFESESSPLDAEVEDGRPQLLPAVLGEITRFTNTSPDQWKINVNEVIRSFVNRNPKHLVLGVSINEAERLVPSILYLAKRASVPVSYCPGLRDRHNCLAAVRVR